MNVSLNSNTCWPECTFGVSTMVILKHMVEFNSIFACLHVVGHTCPWQCVQQVQFYSYTEHKIILNALTLCYIDVNSSEEGWGQ